MGCPLPVLLSVPAVVTPAADVPANEADPQIVGAVAVGTDVGHARPKGLRVWVVTVVFLGWLRVGRPADGTPRAFPCLETSAVEDMLA